MEKWVIVRTLAWTQRLRSTKQVKCLWINILFYRRFEEVNTSQAVGAKWRLEFSWVCDETSLKARVCDMGRRDTFCWSKQMVCCIMAWNDWPVSSTDCYSYERLSCGVEEVEQRYEAFTLQDQCTLLESLRLMSLLHKSKEVVQGNRAKESGSANSCSLGSDSCFTGGHAPSVQEYFLKRKIATSCTPRFCTSENRN